MCGCGVVRNGLGQRGGVLGRDSPRLDRLGCFIQLPGQRIQAAARTGGARHRRGQRIQPVFQPGRSLVQGIRLSVQGLQTLVQGIRPCLCLLCPLGQTVGALLDLLCAVQRLCRAGIQRGCRIRQGFGLALQLGQAFVQRLHLVIHLGSTAGQRIAAGLGLGRALGQLGRAVVQSAHALGQFRRRCPHLVHAILQLQRTVVQLLCAVRHLLHPLGVLGQTLGQGLAAAAEGQGAVRQKFQIFPDGIVAVGQLPGAVLDLACAVRRLLHAVPHLGELVQHGFGVGLGHLFPDPRLNLFHGGLAQFGGNVVGARVGLVCQLHLTGLVIGQRGRIGGEILRNGDHHIIGTVRKALCRIVGIRQPEVKRGVLLQIVHQLVAHVQGFALILHRLILIDQCHRQVFHAAIGVPHGTEKQGRVDGGDGDDGQHHHKHQPVAQQLFPFTFQHRTKQSLPFLYLCRKQDTVLFIHRCIAFYCIENYTKQKEGTQPTISHRGGQ